MASGSDADQMAVYVRVKAGFIMRGTSFTGWCTSQGLPHANVRSAILGTWKGPKGKAVAALAIAASGASELCH